jgi:flagellar biosynthetic protein FliR
VTEWAVGQVLLFTLVFLRMTGLVVFVPFFDETSHPVQFKAGFAAVLSVLVTGLAAASAGRAAPLQWGLGAYAWAGLCEFGTGAVIGLAARAVLEGVQLAGHIMGRNIGLAIANVVDPQRDIEVSIVGQFKMLLVIAIFVGLDGHHVFLLAMARSYEVVPVAGLTISWPLVSRLVDGVGYLLAVGATLSAPVIAAGLLANVALGLLGRTVPQMNIFIIGFPVRILLGFGVLLLMISLTVGIAEAMIARERSELGAVIRLMSPPI